MAVRPVFISLKEKPYVKVDNTEFKYYSGFALSQCRKSIESLHNCFVLSNPGYTGLVLEISTKSNASLGNKLSAFNLMYRMSDGIKRPVESVFQASKFFSNGKQYTEILNMSSVDAKHYPALTTSGNVVSFRLEGMQFRTEPKTFFYDWLYINALNQNKELANDVLSYRAFTDIAFNPAKSINCQAHSVALFVALSKAERLKDAVSSPERFLDIVYGNTVDEYTQTSQEPEQLSMFSM